MLWKGQNLVGDISEKNDENFTFVSAWENKGEPSNAILHKEELIYENIELKTRSYK
jgi:succinate dehydrogenase / fumarate reductase flavoprotein subunit